MEQDIRELLRKIDGNFRLEEKLGEGGYGTAYLVDDLDLETLVVFKRLHESMDIEKFKQEARVTANLKHPNIADVFRFGEKDGAAFFIAKYEGDNLNHLIHEEYKGKIIPLDITLEVMSQIASALNHAHNEHPDYRVIHRDIKPSNIFISKDRKNAKLGDFGIAKLIRRGEFEKAIVDDVPHLGTVSYMAPEQFEGKSDERSDIYSLGVVFYEMLTGINPFHIKHGEVTEDVRKRTVEQEITFPIGVNISKTLEDIVIKALDKDPDRRFQTAKELYDDLESYRKGKILRRRFNAVCLIALGIFTIGGPIYLINNHLKYKGSIDYIIDEIRETEATDFERMDPLLAKLTFRTFDQKVRWWVEGGRISEGMFPYGTIEDNKFHETDGKAWTAGFFKEILKMGYQVTGDRKFLEYEQEWGKHIVFTKKEIGISPIRFHYAQKNILKAAEYFDALFDEEVGFYDFGHAYTSHFGGNLGKNERIMDLNTTTTILPLIWSASDLLEGEDKEEYINKAISHLKLIQRLCIRPDFSTIELVKFDLDGNVIDVAYKLGDISLEKPCHARTHTRTIEGFITGYQRTRDKSFFETGLGLLSYYVSRLPRDLIPYYDLNHIEDPNGNIPKDTSATGPFCLALVAGPQEIVEDPEMKKLLYGTLKTLTTKHLDPSSNN